VIPRILGHRGASALAPENTLEAFRLALERGADGIEYDVQLSRDGHAVVFHDTALERTTRAEGPLGARDLHDLERLVAGPRESAGCRIPRLASVLERVPGIHDLEIKLPDTPFPPALRTDLVPACARAFGSALRRGAIAPSSALTSFDLPSLDLLCRLAPDLRFGPIVEDEDGWKALHAWRPARPPAVLSLSARLLPRLLDPGEPLPRPFERARLWLWHLDESTPATVLPWRPEAVVVDDPGRVRGLLAAALDDR